MKCQNESCSRGLKSTANFTMVHLPRLPYTVHCPMEGYCTQSCSGFGVNSSEQTVLCTKKYWLASLFTGAVHVTVKRLRQLVGLEALLINTDFAHLTSRILTHCAKYPFVG